MRSKRSALARNLLLLFASIAFACAVGEAYLRYFDPQPLESVYMWSVGTLRHIPSFTYRYSRRGYSNKVSFNALGLRGPEVAPEKKPGVPRILFLGDSFVEGKQVADDQVITAVMGRLAARAGHPIEVINAGVAGYGTAEEILLWNALRKQLDPDIVLLGFYPNDVRNNVDRKLAVELPGEPIRVRKPNMRHFGMMYRIRKFFAARSHLYMLFTLAWRQEMEEEEPRHRPEPNQGAYRDTGIGTPLESEDVFAKRRIPSVARGWTMTLALLADLDHSAQAAGAKFEIVMFPTRYQVDDKLWLEHAKKLHLSPDQFDLRKPQEIFKEWTDRFPVRVLDLLDDFRARNSYNSFYYSIDAHWNAAGHSLAAQLIDDDLIRGGLLGGA